MKPPQIWIDIMRTNKLCNGQAFQRADGHMWMRFPTRDMRGCQLRPGEGFQLHGVDFDGDEPVGPVYHNTPLSSLVSHNPFAPGSRGILVERGLRYGSRWHGPCRGVNFYLDGGLETFAPGGGWISLEL